MKKSIPLTKEMIRDYYHSNTLFYLLSLIYHTAEKQEYWFDTDKKSVKTFLSYNKYSIRKLKETYNFERHQFTPFMQKMNEIFIVESDTFICLMPFEVWKEFLDWVISYPLKIRSGIIAVFLYCYLTINMNPGSVPIAAKVISRDLEMQESTVRGHLLKLVDKGFLLTNGHYFSQYKMVNGIELPPQGKKYDLPQKLKTLEWFEHFGDIVVD